MNEKNSKSIKIISKNQKNSIGIFIFYITKIILFLEKYF